MGVMAAKKSKEKDLSLRGHLEELRQRLIKSVAVVLLTTIVSFVFARDLFEFFQSRAPENVSIAQLHVTELVSVYMKVCLYSGIVLALPFLVYQLVMFIHPALTRKEKAYLYLLLPGVLVFFGAGAAFAYYVFIPRAMEFLLDFPLLDGIDTMISIGDYISVITRLLVAMGLLFELPIITFFLAKVGVVNHRQLRKYWRYAIVGSFVVAAVVTPTPDPLNCIIVAVPVMLLYVLGIVLAWIARKDIPETV